MSGSNKETSKHKNPWLFVTKDEDGRLVPYANYDRERFELLPVGKVLRCNIAQQRSQPRHRLYRVVLRQVIKNTDLFVDEDHLHESLLIGCGVVKPVMAPNGEIWMVPSSTAFNAMKEETFKAYFDQAMLVIQASIIPGIDLQELLAEAKREAHWQEKEAA